MGILDDAIREHLDLKRRQGAAEDELQRLEDEAFGPPSRPGDPDFAERGPEGEQGESPQGEAAGNGGAEATATETALFHDQESEGGSEAALAESPPAAESPAFEVEESPLEATERPASEGETIAELAGEPTVEHDTLGAEGKAENVDLDLDLNLDEEVEDAEGVEELELDDEDVEATGGEQAAPAVAGTAEDPVESLDTVEHHFEDAIDEAEVVEDEPTSLLEDSDDDDVLEETPEFLRDAPEDDELWFEQGEPKDFDF